MKFEYLVLPIYNYTFEDETELNKLGLEGWELIAITEFCECPRMIFKRIKTKP